MTTENNQDAISYEAAFSELKTIARELEEDSIPVDVLARKVKRASELIRICQMKLRTAEDEVNGILDEMSEDEEDEG